MVYFIAAVSAVATGALFALGFRIVTGIEHAGILFAIGVMGAGLQSIMLIGWYLRATGARREAPRGRPD